MHGGNVSRRLLTGARGLTSALQPCGHATRTTSVHPRVNQSKGGIHAQRLSAACCTVVAPRSYFGTTPDGRSLDRDRPPVTNAQRFGGAPADGGGAAVGSAAGPLLPPASPAPPSDLSPGTADTAPGVSALPALSPIVVAATGPPSAFAPALSCHICGQQETV